MGLLDDAIREHLELKRRHGADPQEVARQEDEALGAPGSEARHVETDHEDDEPAAPYEEPAAVHEDQHELDLPPLAEEPAEEPAHVASELPRQPPEPPEVHQPTVEYSVEDEQAAEEPPADELEETPEFLQETPEHDRLWFEQKPPRDFDF
jgi:hypothetical protein